MLDDGDFAFFFDSVTEARDETGEEIALAWQNARDVATSRVDAAVTSMLDKEARSLGPTSGGGESPEGQSSSPILGSQSRTPGGKPIGSKEEFRAALQECQLACCGAG